MELLSKKLTNAKERPIRVLQFGEGNFLRAFVDYMIDIANEKGVFDGGIAIVKPINFGNLDRFYAQDSQYTVSLRGVENGEKKQINRIVSSIGKAIDLYTPEGFAGYNALAISEDLRFIVSNTTEAGIIYDETDKFEVDIPNTYPGKLVKFLFQRYTHFNGDASKGLIILPCELIDNNGIVLKDCVHKLIALWNLPEEFKAWVDEACEFCATLVDRIVTGYPRDEAEQMWKEFGYQDNLLVTGELFALWVIEGSEKVAAEFPLDKAGLPVIFTDNHKPYKERKVRILNGAHTSFCLASYLAGNDTVLESMEDKDVRGFIEEIIFDEIIPTLSLSKEELTSFANAVLERFENPFIRHELLAISLNSVSKWRARCMPSLLASAKNTGKLPVRLTFSLASLIAFYADGTMSEDGKQLVCKRGDNEYRVTDDLDVLTFFAERKGIDSTRLAEEVISNEKFFGSELVTVPGICEQVAAYLDTIKTAGMREAIKSL